MKRKVPITRPPLAEAKRMKLESEGYRTTAWSGDLTAEEYKNYQAAEKMFDVKRNPGINFKQLNPLDKRTFYWFYCHEHGYYFENSTYSLIVKGFGHAMCTQDLMGDDFYQVAGYFVSAEDGSRFEDLTYGSNVMCDWKCEKGHVTSMNPKRIAKSKGFKCKVCKLEGKSLKDLYPDDEKYFIRCEDEKRKYADLTVGSNQLCVWHCAKMLHEIKLPPKSFFIRRQHRCKDCSSMKEVHPEYEKYYIQKDNPIPFHKVLYGSKIICKWYCEKLQHVLVRTPKQFSKTKDRYCKDCNLLSSVSPELFKQLDTQENKKHGIDISILTHGLSKEVFWKCEEDSKHPPWKAPVAQRYAEKLNCPTCGKQMSAIERKMQNLLKDRKICYEQQKKFPDLRYINKLSCDFYIEAGIVSKQGVIIEVDGPCHFGIGILADEQVNKRDRIKNIFAKTRGFHLLRVDMDSSPQYGSILDGFLQDIKYAEAPVHCFRGRFYDEEYRTNAYIAPN